MAKIKLAVEDLSVESFHVTPQPAAERGTVLAHESEQTCHNSNCPRTCTDMTDCWGLCYPESGSLGCPGDQTNAQDYTCHLGTCAYFVTCAGYRGEDTCYGTCEGFQDTCGWQCGN
jgi:hypothetical protein